MITAAFAGLPNTGKSSWINKLSNSSFSTGNWNGVTVQKHEAVVIKDHHEIRLIDLPGIYGFHQASDEERITEAALHDESIDCLIQVMDACHMRSSLNLFMELRNFQIPMIVLINFQDEANKNHISIDVHKLSKRLSVPVFYGSASNHLLKEEILNQIENSSSMQVCYRPLLNPEADRIFEQYMKFHNIKKAIELFRCHHTEIAETEQERAVESCIRFVQGNMKNTYEKTICIDRLYLHSTFGKICFLFIVMTLFIVMIITGLFLSDWLSEIFNDLIRFLLSLSHFNDLVKSYIEHVIISGIGALVGFFPILMCLSLFHHFLLESGIMARLTLISDVLMRNFGLTGKSFLCFLLAHGCNVPAVISSTSLENEGIRKKTALLTPFCLCSARFAVLLAFARLMFRDHLAAIVVVIYGISLWVIVMISLILSKFKTFQIDEMDFIELPAYRKVNLSIMMKKTIHSSKEYIQKIVVFLLLILSAIWVAMNVSIEGVSLYESISKLISLMFVPLKFGRWWGYAAALIPGFIAKEATFGILMMLMENTQALSSDPSVNLIFLVYFMLTMPCIMTLSSQKQYYGYKFMIQSAFLSLVSSYLLCFLMVQFIMLF